MESQWKSVAASLDSSGDYVTLCLDVSEEMRAEACISAIDLHFLHAIDADISLDYLFVGPRNTWNELEGYKSDSLHVRQCTTCGYLEKNAHSFSNGLCVCGEKEAFYDKNLTILNHSLNLQSYIGVDYTISHGKNSVLRTDYDSFYVMLKLDDGEEQLLPVLHGASTYTAYEIKTTATQMTRTLTATLYAVSKADGKTYHGPANIWCVRDGVMELLEKETDGARRTLEADLLNYGAAAQTAFGVNTDDLANSRLGSYAQYATSGTPEIGGTVTRDGKGLTFRKKSLALQSTIELQFIFSKGSYNIENLEALIVYDGQTHTVPVSAYGSYGTFSYDGLAPNELRKNLYIAVYDKTTGQVVSERLTGSVEAFAAEKLTEYANDNAKQELILAMMRYSDSARAVYGNG